MLFGDWRDTRAVLEAGYAAIGETHPGDLPERDWKLAEAMIAAFRDRARRPCAECGKMIDYRAEIVCLDCGCALHKECAPRHFWPNGRPKTA